MKQVVLFTPTLITGGAEKFVVDLAVNMDRKVFDVTVATLAGIIPNGFASNKFLSVLQANQIEVLDLSGRNRIETLRKVNRFFSKRRPEIIHTNLSTILYVMVFATFYRTETRLFTFHNPAGFTAEGLKKQLYRLAFTVFRFTPVAICDFVKDTIAREYRLPYRSIPCVYNGVDTKAFRPSARALVMSPDSQCRENSLEEEILFGKTVEFISTGILYHVKNHKLLIDAFAIAHARHPNIRLNILGDGELRGMLERQIAVYRLEKKIVIQGITDRVANHLNKADVYIMSSNLEGLPLSVLEAMACGLPVITTAAGGVVDIVTTGYNGMVTPVGDVVALADAMILLTENEAMRKSMGAASRKKAVELDLRNCVSRYQSLYLTGKPDDSSEKRMAYDAINS
ncbi:glycosyltransferase family 4 protein [Anoxybacterium hadale]|uniref:Glycosyltransferase family 4 protein n=1 Tax=Anoxybacterium hadale TaxID=3408580 RepID=A0ACD1AFK0_9FIRM|nr:glycosyltransferase family 4 protein [Clostridiales bacterium]